MQRGDRFRYHLYMLKSDFEKLDEMAEGWGYTRVKAISRLINEKYASLEGKRTSPEEGVLEE